MKSNEEKSLAKFILKSKEFPISIDFNFLHCIDHDIYKALITKKEYEIKSDVNEDVFSSFMQSCIKNEFLGISIENISQYEKICEEFDYKQYSIHLFKNSLVFPLQNQNIKLKKQFKAESDEIKEKSAKYHQIIQILFNQNKNYSKMCIAENKKELFDACESDDIKFVNLIMANKIEQNGFSFILNENNLKASIFRCLSISNDVFVPKSIKHNLKEYNVTRIIENSFKSNKVKSIRFSDDSKLEVIEKNSFLYSSLEEIVIPSSVTQIESSAFSECYQLKKIEFAPNSKLRTIESNTFYYTSIENIMIPSHVTKICEFAFCECEELKKIEFEENSELKIIENGAFADSSLQSISLPSSLENLGEESFNYTPLLNHVNFSENNNRYRYLDGQFIIEKSDSKSDIFDTIIFARRDIETAVIPPFIKRIAPYAFYYCYKLKDVTFCDRSELKSIGKFAFCGSSIECLTIPPSLVDLEQGCFKDACFLSSITISPNNKNYFYYDDKFILGKSDKKSDIFDVLIFAQKKIETAVIPSFICHIAPYAFEECRFIKNVEFEENSKLKTIGHHAFNESSLRTIKIPSNVTIINDHVFSCCDKLEKVEFQDKSKLMFIDNSAFSGSSIKSIVIPESVIQISDHSFSDCFHIDKFEIEEKSKLKFIGNYAFYNSSLKYLKIPPRVFYIGKSAFAFINSLQICEFDDDTQMEQIDKSLFKFSPKAIIMIPSRFVLKSENI
ncbi:hypothetical protein M9Y10_018888 [Tritrichomonas musculus]|uniref:Surface antigen BspA-like n=1 Tax=Tritrichomonas musculus TaxID=1915356 RepID=A0ABR2HI39_9EUKA